MYTWARTSSKDKLSEREWVSLFQKLESVRHIQGIMQHHDAITGTMREHVLLDYYQMIYKANEDAALVIETLGPLVTGQPDLIPDNFHVITDGTFLSLTELSKSPQFVIFFNSLPWTRTEMVSLEIDDSMVEVFDLTAGAFTSSSVLPPTPCFIHGKEERTNFRVFFETEVPPIGYKIYIVYKIPFRDFTDTEISGNEKLWNQGLNHASFPGFTIKPLSSDIFISNDEMRVNFDSNGGLKSVTQIHGGTFAYSRDNSPSGEVTMQLKKDYWEYKSDSSWDNHYTFKAADDGTKISAHSEFYVIKTPLVQEVLHKVNDKIMHRVTLFKNQNQVQVTDLIGPPERGKNYVARYTTSMITDGHFYTDDSGLEMLQRTYNTSDIYSGNYYPMIFSSFIREEDYPFTENPFRQLSIVTDRTHGITSQYPGTFDLMLHRNTLQPHGNGEKMEDWNPVEITSWLLITKEDNYKRQQASMRLNFPLEQVHYSSEFATETVKATASFISEDFPADVFLMNLEYNGPHTEDIAIRVNNLRQKDVFELYESPQFSEESILFAGLHQEISIYDVFNSDTFIHTLEERSLSLNQPVENCKRHHWHSHGEYAHEFQYGESIIDLTGESKKGIVSLPPLGIRSFLAQFSTK